MPRRPQHFARRNPHHPNFLVRQPGIPPQIPLGPVPHVVAESIHLHRQPRRRTVEIQNVSTNWMLPPKLRLDVSQLPPEQGFRQARLSPQLACQGNVPRAPSSRQDYPSVSRLRRLPPPRLCFAKTGRTRERTSPFSRSANGEGDRPRSGWWRGNKNPLSYIARWSHPPAAAPSPARSLTCETKKLPARVSSMHFSAQANGIARINSDFGRVTQCHPCHPVRPLNCR